MCQSVGLSTRPTYPDREYSTVISERSSATRVGRPSERLPGPARIDAAPGREDEAVELAREPRCSARPSPSRRRPRRCSPGGGSAAADRRRTSAAASGCRTRPGTRPRAGARARRRPARATPRPRCTRDAVAGQQQRRRQVVPHRVAGEVGAVERVPAQVAAQPADAPRSLARAARGSRAPRRHRSRSAPRRDRRPRPRRSAETARPAPTARRPRARVGRRQASCPASAFAAAARRSARGRRSGAPSTSARRRRAPRAPPRSGSLDGDQPGVVRRAAGVKLELGAVGEGELALEHARARAPAAPRRPRSR